MRLVFLLPLLVAALLGGFLLWGLDPERDPNAVPSVLVDRPVPDYALPELASVGVPGLSRADHLEVGEPHLLNVFASWCGPCRIEHPVLVRMAQRDGVRLFGLNYKDAPDDARAWLAEVGNPYERIGSDVSGRIGLEWGVFGVPETFVIAADGTVLMRHVGPIITPEAEAAVLKALDDARARGGAGA